MKRSVRFLSLLAGIVAVTTASAHGPKNVDVRAGQPAKVSLSALPSADDATAKAGGAVASRDDASGRPTFLWAIGSVPGLTGGGGDVAAAAHLKRFAATYELSPAALSTAKVVRVHDTGRGGIIVTFRQSIGDIELFQSDAKVLMRRNKELVAISGGLHPDATPTGKPGTRDFKLTPERALASSLADLFGVAVTDKAVSPHKDKDAGGYQRFDLLRTPVVDAARLVFSEPARVKKVFFPLAERIVPAYFVEVYAGEATSNDALYYRYIIAADDGRTLQRQSLTADVQYRVWADPADLRPLDGPHADFTPHPTGVPDGSYPPFVPSVLIDANGFNSPNGGAPDPWLPHPSFPVINATFGNNVDAYTDHGFPDGFSNGDQRAVVNGPDLFDYSYDPLAGPLVTTDQSMASTVQLFYVNNYLHDYFYDSGFNEAAGNAQFLNYERGGVGGDALRAEAQDSAIDWSEVPGGPQQLNNANMSVPSDGVAPRMQMYLFQGLETISLTSQPGDLSYVAAGGVFGPQSFDVTADAVVADDGGGASASDGCEPLVNNVAGRVVLVDRGSCPFVVKVANAEAAGAVGAIIANNQPGAPFVMGPGPVEPTIPAMMISQADGAAVKAALLSGPLSLHLLRQQGTLRDGSLDNMIITHEWGHYLHYRLAAGGTTMMGAESEGWADFIALHTSVREGDDLDGTYGAAIYAPVVFGDAGYFGIRRTAYSVDPTKNELRFRHISDGEPLPVNQPLLPNGGPNAEVHNAGEVWASMMFEAYVALLKQTELANPPYDFDEARRRMADYVVAGMQLAPLDATYTEARDGVIAAALAADPADAQLIAEAFAVRGAGSCAESPPRFSTDLVGVVESYELAPRALLRTVTVDDSVEPCESDGFLDAGETGVITVQVQNSGLEALIGAEVRVSTTTAGVWFPSGDTVSLADVAALGAGSATVDIALDDSVVVDITDLELSVEVVTPGSCVETTQRDFFFTSNIDFVDGVSATETAENPHPVWTKGGSLGEQVWSIQQVSATDHLWNGIDFGSISDTSLESPDLEVSASDAFVITFDHAYSFEYEPTTPIAWDGGMIEISADGGASWVDISTYVDPGYQEALFTGSGNPLGGRMAFVGASAGFPAPTTLSLDLGTQLAGQTVRVRFRIGTDGGVGAPGWFLDNLAFEGIDNLPFGTAIPHDFMCQSAPIAVAGPDQDAQSGVQVILDGTASSDPDGDPITITWSQVGGDPVDVFPGVDGLAAIVTPEVTEDLSLTFMVTVSDGVATSVDTMNVFIDGPISEGGGGAGEGGAPGEGGAGGAQEGGNGAGDDEDGDVEGGGCDCRVASPAESGSQGRLGWLAALAGALAWRGRRRRAG